MYRILLVETPNYKNKDYFNVKKKYNDNLQTFHKHCLKMKSKLSDKFKIKLIGFDGTIKHTYNYFNKSKIIKDIKSMPMGNTKCSGLSLYADYNPKTTTKGIGYGSKEKALKTLNIIKKRNNAYKKRVVTTMYYRAKHHKYQTKGMKDAEKIYKKWLNQHGGGFKFLKMDLIKKFYPLANQYQAAEVCRGIKKAKTTDKGFLEVYSKVKNENELKKIPVRKNNPNGSNWYKTRENRLKAKMGQMKSQKIDYFHKSGKMKGLPTKMHIILIMWGYSPYEDKLKKIKIMN